MPGDVLVLLRGKATCDMVLLRGNCLVEESMLSGEVPHFDTLNNTDASAACGPV